MNQNMKQKPHTQTAWIYHEEKHYCKDCGWPVIMACCNDETGALFPNDDWIIYCANKGCQNHKGAGVFQDLPSFVVRS